MRYKYLTQSEQYYTIKTSLYNNDEQVIINYPFQTPKEIEIEMNSDLLMKIFPTPYDIDYYKIKKGS